MNERKKCPYCGKEIAFEILKCNHCGELLENYKSFDVEEPPGDIRKCYKTRELTIWQKIFQVYWANPKSWLLDEFVIENEQVTFKVKNGNVISASILDLKVRTQEDQYGRREVYITHEKQKLHFKEIPWMLTDEEWEEVFNILDSLPNTGLTKLGWLTTIANTVINVIN